jgi:hypothetical protein
MPPMTHDHDCTTLSPEEDIEIALKALAEGDHPHAAFHVAMALADDPVQTEWLDLFDLIVSQAPEPDDLVPLEGTNAFYGEAAARARVIARSGQPALGLELLLQVIGAVPHLPYETWAMDWLDDVHETDELPHLPFGRVLATLCYSSIGRLATRPAEKAHLGRFAPLAQAFADHPSASSQPVVLALGSGLMRRIGDLSAATSFAGASLASGQTTFGYSALGLAHRAGADYDSAVEAFQSAQSLEPADPSYPSEQGRALWDAGNFAEAARAFAAGLERGNGDNEAAMSHDYVAHKADLPTHEDPAWLFRWLGDQAGPDDIRYLVTPLVGWMPEPSEATVNVMIQLWEEYGADPTGEEFTFTLSAVEPPSALLAMAHWVADSCELAASKVTIDHVQMPDPRRTFGEGPLGEGGHLWEYDGPNARQTVGAPPDFVGATIASVATAPYFLPTWWAAAQPAAVELAGATDEELLGTMVHPPPRHPDVPPWLWVFYHQIAAALTIARLDEPWSAGRRHRLLMGLACGPTDWTVGAAILALGQLALDEPEATEDIAEFFEALRERVPENQECCFAEILCHTYLMLPCRPTHERAAFEELAEAHGDDADATDEEGAQP